MPMAWASLYISVTVWILMVVIQLYFERAMGQSNYNSTPVGLSNSSFWAC